MDLAGRGTLLHFGFLTFVLAGCSGGRGPDGDGGGPGANQGRAPVMGDLDAVDAYLEKWDRFARGENTLAPQLREDKAAFEAALTRLLEAKDRRAPGRLVFYAVVKVGGSIIADSELGRACTPILGPDFPVVTRKDGGKNFFCGDLYFWWQDHRGQFEAYPLFEEWKGRDYAQRVAIPMYEAVRRRR